ncbi:hypothetical protein [Salinisphaera sp. T31B1]|uniref:hypothetical protein n=1 Tax=Salinisphaera sp. T31B1 TaxID=727963 RepID=UPI0033425CCD
MESPHHARLRRLRLIAMPLLLVVGLASALSGCATLAGQDRSNTGRAQAGVESPRDQLNDGYSDLYSSASALAEVDKLFYVKVESDDVQRVVEDVTGYSAQLAERLKSLTADFPALALDRTVDPPIIKAARDAQKKATLKRFAPVVGDTGKAFERGLLIRLLGAVDQQHYMAATLAEREPVPALSRIMASAAQRYAGFYDEIDTLLNERFYR